MTDLEKTYNELKAIYESTLTRFQETFTEENKQEYLDEDTMVVPDRLSGMTVRDVRMKMWEEQKGHLAYLLERRRVRMEAAKVALDNALKG